MSDFVPGSGWSSSSTLPADRSGTRPSRRRDRRARQNAGNNYAGYFEALTPEQIERRLNVNLFGPMNVTRAVLPVMRNQRSGHILTISSTAGFAAYEGGTAYATSKFAVDGWMESLAPEIAPFGIHTTIVNPGFFPTELLTNESTTRPARASRNTPSVTPRSASSLRG